MVDAMEVSSINIKTEYAGEKEYPIFTRSDGKTAQCAIILGKNGSGKTTIARALDGGSNVEFFDKNEGFLGCDCSNVYVFNEEYVIKNFRIYEPEHLETFVLLGKSGRILDRINNLEGRIVELENEVLNLKNSIFNRFAEEKISGLVGENIDSSMCRYIESNILKELSGFGLYDLLNRGLTRENERRQYRALNSQIFKLREQVNLKRGELEAETRMESAKDVIGYINQWLYLVLGKNGIYLEFADQFGYTVKFKTGDKDEAIHPSRLSLGEQNILSLCYFLASTLENKNISGFLQEDQIIVLDDPVSSFDDGNKYGVTSLLGYLCQSILSKASKTKLIIMTHDLSFAANMEKMIKAIDDSKLSCLELQKDSSDVLIKSKFKDIDKYADILRNMYEFALHGANAPVVPAPNDVRRVWEAFLMFELGETSIAEMGAMKKLSESFSKDKQIEGFIKIFIPQLFINSDSHSRSQVINGNMYLTPTLVGKPYEDFVKNIVCCMHIIAPRHIAWRMKKYDDGEGKSILKFVKELDDLLKDVLNNPKLVTAMGSLGEIERLYRMRHRGGRAPHAGKRAVRPSLRLHQMRHRGGRAPQRLRRQAAGR